MLGRNARSTRLNRQLIGDPLDLHGHMLQPVARLTGRAWSFGSTGMAARLHIVPVEILVSAAGGTTYRVLINVRRESARGWGMLAAALALPLACLLAMTLQMKKTPPKIRKGVDV